MERRKAITAAAAASLTLLAGAAGIALNSGIVGAGGHGNVGQLSPVGTSTNPPVTVSVDDPAATNPVTAAPSVKPTESRPVTASAGSSHQGSDRYDDKRDDLEHEDHHAYEGAEDDD
jgi:hypothetical protein